MVIFSPSPRFVQRFGESLNLNVHFHVLVLDGVVTRTAEGVAFNEVPAPEFLARLAALVPPPR